MALKIVIADTHLNHRFAFGNHCELLKDLNQDQLLELAILMRQTKVASNLVIFKQPLPTMNELMAEKNNADIAAVKANTYTPTVAPISTEPEKKIA